jgi:hypothetical protein
VKFPECRALARTDVEGERWRAGRPFRVRPKRAQSPGYASIAREKTEKGGCGRRLARREWLRLLQACEFPMQARRGAGQSHETEVETGAWLGAPAAAVASRGRPATDLLLRAGTTAANANDLHIDAGPGHPPAPVTTGTAFSVFLLAMAA